ncbi:MAG: GTP cyclohydrolase II [Candidatus Puniceispirillaceae bacterium]
MSQTHFFGDLKLDRVFMILRRGGFVMLRDERGQAGLLRAAEFADYIPDPVAHLAQSNEILCLTARHLQAFGKSVRDGFDSFSLPANSLAEGDILGLVLGDKRALPEAVNLLAERRDSLPDLACRLLRAARLVPAGLLTRMSMKDSHQLHHFSENYQIPILDFHEITSLKRDIEVEMSITTSARLPLAVTEEAKIVMFRQKNDRQEHFAILVGSEDYRQPPLVRLHSQCVTGDVLGSLKCDCGPQLQKALAMMAEAGSGILLYLAQEGRDIGLLNKIRAYALQDRGMDTVDANHSLGFETDERLFGPAAAMLKALKVDRLKLLTNNPDKIARLEAHGIKVMERIGLELQANPHNAGYLKTKAERTGHLLKGKG